VLRNSAGPLLAIGAVVILAAVIGVTVPAFDRAGALKRPSESKSAFDRAGGKLAPIKPRRSLFPTTNRKAVCAAIADFSN